MSRDSWKPHKLKYLTLFALLVLMGGFMLSLPSLADIPSLSEKPLTMDFKNVDLKDAIGMLSFMTGWNIVVDKDVQGTADVRFEKVPALRILSEILETNDCRYEIEENIIGLIIIPLYLILLIAAKVLSKDILAFGKQVMGKSAGGQ